MRTFLTVLTCLILFATPVMAGDWEDAVAAFKAGDYQKAFRLNESLAEQGDASAQFNLGWIYHKGLGVTEDDAKAVHWFLKAAEQGFYAAQYNLGRKYQNGEGVPKDDAQAFYWYSKAAEQGISQAQANLGLLYAQGKGIPEDLAKGYAWSSIAAAQENKQAKRNKSVIEKHMTPAQIANSQELAFKYWEKYVVPFQEEDAVAAPLEARNVAAAKAAFQAGNYDKAFLLLRRLAEHGHLWAQVTLGSMYDEGKGVPEDVEKSIYWITKGIENTAWQDAFDADKAGEYRKAFRLYEPLAEKGDSDGQYRLGWMYATGEGVPKDYTKAVYWYRKAAKQGDALAQLMLGYAYAGSQGVAKDDTKAVYWFGKAAEQGISQAQSNLGIMYANGIGVLEDYVQAYAWWSIAATRGDKSAKNNKGIIEGRMTPAQVAEAQKLSSEYWETYVVPFQ